MDHGLLATCQMNNNFRLITTLPPASEVLVAQDWQLPIREHPARV